MASLVLPKIDVRSLSFEQLAATLTAMGERPFRAQQLFRWIHKRGARTFAEMTDLSAGVRGQLEERCQLGSLTKDSRAKID